MLFAFIIGLTYLAMSSTDKVFKTCEIIGVTDMDSIDFRAHDSVLIAASTLYDSNFLKDLMQGEQYREAWSTPINVPIVFLDTLMGGMTVLEEGGGKQTHSLKVKNPKGILYSLRSINKDPQALIPDFARSLGLENIIVDGISAQHPYAAVIAAKLAEKAQILHTDPKIVFVPKQETLAEYNDKYGNRIYLLEHETDGGQNWTSVSNVFAIVDTDDLQELKIELRNNLSVDREALVRARLFDILIGDWDRHAKQWGWVVQQNDTNFSAIPLPGDRDNAFFNIGGLIPTIIANKNILPGLQSFEKDIDYLPGLVMPFDVYFLTNTPDHIFKEEAIALQNLMTNKAIEEAFQTWPQELRKLDAEKIEKIIKDRRDNLLDYAAEFKAVIDTRKLLNKPLKGSEDEQLPKYLHACFECGNTTN